MTVRLLIKYLVNKLKLDSESEVFITHNCYLFSNFHFNAYIYALFASFFVINKIEKLAWLSIRKKPKRETQNQFHPLILIYMNKDMVGVRDMKETAELIKCALYGVIYFL